MNLAVDAIDCDEDRCTELTFANMERKNKVILILAAYALSFCLKLPSSQGRNINNAMHGGVGHPKTAHLRTWILPHTPNQTPQTPASHI